MESVLWGESGVEDPAVSAGLCPVFVVLWEAMSSAAWGLSEEACRLRSESEWSEAIEMEEEDPAFAARCVVRAEMWECLAARRSVSAAWRSVSEELGEWRAFMSRERGVEVASVAGMCRPAGCPPRRPPACPPACL